MTRNLEISEKKPKELRLKPNLDNATESKNEISRRLYRR